MTKFLNKKISCVHTKPLDFSNKFPQTVPVEMKYFSIIAHTSIRLYQF